MPSWRGVRSETGRVYGAGRPVYLFFILFFSIVLSAGAASALDDPYLDELLTRVRSENLHRDRYWQILLHYKPTAAKNPTSLVDDPKFFLAPDGKTNPSGELEATLRGLFQDDLQGDDAVACRFPARTAWLQSSLGIDVGRLPKVSCRRLEEALAAAESEADRPNLSVGPHQQSRLHVRSYPAADR